MRTLRVALVVEVRKALASRVLGTTTILLAVGMALLTGALVAAARAGNQQVAEQLGPLVDGSGWTLLTGVAAQIIAAGAMLAFGVALSWTFGREFTDGTIAGLFALPVPRATIAVAKLLVHALWVVLVAAALTVLVLAAGIILGLGTIDGAVLAQFARQFTLTTLTGLVITPAGWAASLGRGMLPGIATSLAILVVAQIAAIAIPTTAAWLPFSAPALWAIQPSAGGPGQVASVAIIPIVFGTLTALAWHRLQLVR